jgi:hypothetical protein
MDGFGDKHHLSPSLSPIFQMAEREIRAAGMHRRVEDGQSFKYSIRHGI